MSFTTFIKNTSETNLKIQSKLARELLEFDTLHPKELLIIENLYGYSSAFIVSCLFSMEDSTHLSYDTFLMEKPVEDLDITNQLQEVSKYHFLKAPYTDEIMLRAWNPNSDDLFHLLTVPYYNNTFEHLVETYNLDITANILKHNPIYATGGLEKENFPSPHIYLTPRNVDTVFKTMEFEDQVFEDSPIVVVEADKIYSIQTENDLFIHPDVLEKLNISWASLNLLIHLSMFHIKQTFGETHSVKFCKVFKVLGTDKTASVEEYNANLYNNATIH